MEQMLILAVLIISTSIGESLTEDHPYIACSAVKCKNDDSCPAGQYLEPSDGFSQCCRSCRTYSQLKQHCNTQQRCAEGLVCVEKTKICEDPTKVCASTTCPSLECPSGTYLVSGDGINQCCDLCQKYVGKGESCDNGRRCSPGLECDGLKRCSESQCSNVSCTPDTKCDIWQYLAKSDGVNVLLRSMHKLYRGQSCNLHSKQCWPSSRCDENNICVTDRCSSVFCSNEDYCTEDEHLMEADGFNVCCDSCVAYTKLGENCNSFLECLPGLACNRDKVCVQENKCANGTYYVSHTGECIPYATYGQSCRRTACAPGYFCNIAQKCTPKEHFDCSMVDCAPDESCPNKQYMVESDGIAVCCQYCENFTHEGDHCDLHKKCQSPLVCNVNNICEKFPEECSKRTCADFRGCPDNQHLVTVEGGLPCCSYCQNNSALGEPCAADKPCIEGLYCNAQNTCAKIDCTKITCHSRIGCPEGMYLESGNGVTRCCNTCRPYAKRWEYCDATQLCQPSKLFCNQNNVCTRTY